MDPKSVTFTFFVCNSDDADVVQSGKRISKLRVGDEVHIAHPSEWMEAGAKTDLMMTRRKDKVVNGEIEFRYVDGIFHRVVGVDHDVARSISSAD